MKCENILMATEARFLLNAPTQTDRLTPDSRQTQTPPGPIICVTTVISFCQSRHAQNLIVSAFYEMRTVKRHKQRSLYEE
jgi:hypothetical protein